VLLQTNTLGHLPFSSGFIKKNWSILEQIVLTEEGKNHKKKTGSAPKKTTITTDNTRLFFFLFLLDNFCMV